MTRLHRHTILALTSLLMIAALTGCSNELTDPQSGDVSSEARAVAVERTSEVLVSSELTRTASMVEDLTGGFAVGLADEAAGLDMELGEEFSLPSNSSAQLSIGASIGRARITRERAVREFTDMQFARPGRR